MKVLISGSVWRGGRFGDQCMAYGLLPNRDQYRASPPGLSYLVATCGASTHMEIRMTLRSSSTGILPKKMTCFAGVTHSRPDSFPTTICA